TSMEDRPGELINLWPFASKIMVPGTDIVSRSFIRIAESTRPPIPSPKQITLLVQGLEPF
ncbi:hypothetical protein, partial [Cellvibrio sp.]